MSKHQQWVADYLFEEGERVRVDDTLPAIEEGISLVVATRGHDELRRGSWLMAAAVAALGLVFVASALASRGSGQHGHSQQTAAPAASVADAQSEPAAGPHATTTSALATTTTLAPATAVATVVTPVPLPNVPLPDGGTVQGQMPSCTTTDNIAFDCTVLDPTDVSGDITGMTVLIVDKTSHVSGGCRSTSVSGLRWACYIGPRASAEGIITLGLLGDYAPIGHSEG